MDKIFVVRIVACVKVMSAYKGIENRKIYGLLEICSNAENDASLLRFCFKVVKQ